MTQQIKIKHVEQVTQLVNLMMWANMTGGFACMNSVYGHCRNAIVDILHEETGLPKEDIAEGDSRYGWNLGGCGTYFEDVEHTLNLVHQRVTRERAPKFVLWLYWDGEGWQESGDGQLTREEAEELVSEEWCYMTTAILPVGQEPPSKYVIWLYNPVGYWVHVLDYFDNIAEASKVARDQYIAHDYRAEDVQVLPRGEYPKR